MRDILAGGILVTPDAIALVSCKPAYSRRRSTARGRVAVRPAPKLPSSPVQPGQLASPFLKFGFPSLAMH